METTSITLPRVLGTVRYILYISVEKPGNFLACFPAPAPLQGNALLQVKMPSSSQPVVVFRDVFRDEDNIHKLQDNHNSMETDYVENESFAGALQNCLSPQIFSRSSGSFHMGHTYVPLVQV